MSHISRLTTFCLLSTVCCFLSTVFCPLSSIALAQEPKNPPNLIAKVNGMDITVRMLNEAMEERIPFTGHRTVSEKRFSEIRKEELDKLILQELLFQETKRLRIKVDRKEVESELDKIKARFPSEDQFQLALKRQGLTLSDLRQGLERRHLIQKVIDQEVHSKISPTDGDLKDYYEGHREQFVIPEQIRLRLILVAVDPSGVAEDWEEGRKKAQGLSDRAKASEDFGSLVAQFSDFEDEFGRERGGDTGLLHGGRLPFQELEPVAFSYHVGEVSEPVRTLYGYVVFRVEEKHPSKPLSYEEVNKELLRREMRSSAAEKRLEEWIKDLKAKAEITIY